MAIEWHTRVLRPFSLRDLRDHAEATLRDVLGPPGDGLRIDVLGDVRQLKTHGVRGADEAPASMLERMFAPNAETFDVVFVIRELDGPVWVWCRERLEGAFEARCNVNAFGRTPIAYTLGIATAIAAAQLSGDDVETTFHSMGPDWMYAPDELLTRLRARGATTLDAAIREVLSTTNLGDRSEST